MGMDMQSAVPRQGALSLPMRPLKHSAMRVECTEIYPDTESGAMPPHRAWNGSYSHGQSIRLFRAALMWPHVTGSRELLCCRESGVRLPRHC
jgi:hypothetical protein